MPKAKLKRDVISFSGLAACQFSGSQDVGCGRVAAKQFSSMIQCPLCVSILPIVLIRIPMMPPGARVCVCMCMEDVDDCRAYRCEPPELLDSEPSPGCLYYGKCDRLAQFRKVQL